jgi:hypothetical protein
VTNTRDKYYNKAQCLICESKVKSKKNDFSSKINKLDSEIKNLEIEIKNKINNMENKKVQKQFLEEENKNYINSNDSKCSICNH